MSASASSLFDPDSFVDRVAEQALFHRLLRHQCKFGNPPVAVCYIALDKLSPCDPYSFAVAAARALSEFDGVGLPGMHEAEERRFDRRMGALADLHGHTDIGSVAEGATVAGISVGGSLVCGRPRARPAFDEQRKRPAARRSECGA